MNPKKRQTKQEEKTAATDFLKKAQDSHEAMLLAFQNNNYNAIGTLAIQCAISSADAICVYARGMRSISQDHGDICALVKSTLLPEANDKSTALKRILAKKNLIQYERRNVFESEATDLIKSSTRIFEWVSLHLKK